MKDIGYIDLEFKGSYMETGIKAETAEQLQYRRGYTLGAIDYHQKEQNPKQIAFFESSLKLIDKRMKRIKKEAGA